MAAKTREEWLERMVKALRPRFRKAGLELPDEIGVTCGWPSEGGLRARSYVDGQCWAASASEGERPEIFISPRVADSIEVGSILAHELVHAVGKHGHGKEFRTAGLAVGLVGKPTSMKAGAELRRDLAAIVERIGEYPHARIKPDARMRPKLTTRLLKATCPECGYTIRAAATWVRKGLPVCVCGGEFEAA